MPKAKTSRKKNAGRKKSPAKGAAAKKDLNGGKEQDKKPQAKKSGEDLGGDFLSLQKIFDEAAQAEAKGGGLQLVDVECPHCGEEFEVRVAANEGAPDMVEECRSCCSSVSLSVEVEDGEVSVVPYG